MTMVRDQGCTVLLIFGISCLANFASGRFSPYRLFTTTLPLIPADSPITIPPSDAACPFVTVRLDFDLRLPGWLPPSIRVSGRGSCAGVGYGVVATAVTSWSDSRRVASMHRLAGLLQESSCSRYTEFTIRRHQMPTAIFPNAPIEHRSFIHTEQQTFSYDINMGTAFLPIEATFTVPDVVDVCASTSGSESASSPKRTTPIASAEQS